MTVNKRCITEGCEAFVQFNFIKYCRICHNIVIEKNIREFAKNERMKNDARKP